MISHDNAAKLIALKPMTSKRDFVKSLFSQGINRSYTFIEINPGTKNIKNKTKLLIFHMSIYSSQSANITLLHFRPPVN
jgi:hypothetical protein